MYNRIRQIHLFSAFLLTVFVLMYFVTGFVMVLEKTFERTDNSVKTEYVHIPGVRSLAGAGLISALKSHANVDGQYQIRQNEDRTQVTFRHPGTESQVLITPDSDQVKVTIRRKNFVATLHQFHRLHGYHGGRNYTLWAIVYDLSSISMILFALTGFYLWYKTERVRWPGWIIFTAFTAFTGFTIVYLSFMH